MNRLFHTLACAVVAACAANPAGAAPAFLGFDPPTGVVMAELPYVYAVFSAPVTGVTAGDAVLTPGTVTVKPVPTAFKTKVAIPLNLNGAQTAHLALTIGAAVVDQAGAEVSNPGTYELDLHVRGPAPRPSILRVFPAAPFLTPTDATLSFEFNVPIQTDLQPGDLTVVEEGVTGTSVTSVEGPTAEEPRTVKIGVRTGEGNGRFLLRLPLQLIATLDDVAGYSTMNTPYLAVDTRPAGVTSLTVDPDFAGTGDEVAITLMTNRAGERPFVKVNGDAATWDGVNHGNGEFTYTYVVPANAPLGDVEFETIVQGTTGTPVYKNFNGQLQIIKQPIQLSPEGEVDDIVDEMPQLASDGNGTLVCVWYVRNREFFESRIRWARSTDHGATWSNAAFFGSGFATSQTGPYRIDVEPTVESQGDLWGAAWFRGTITYVNGEPQGGTPQLVFARSTNDGQSWLNPVNIHSVNYTALVPYSQNRPALAPMNEQGTWIIAWSENALPYPSVIGEPEIYFSDVFVSRGTNGGATWSAPINLSASMPEEHGAKDQKLAFDSLGNVICLWDEWAVDDFTDIAFINTMITRSGNAGVNWSDPQPLMLRNGPQPVRALVGEIVKCGPGKFAMLCFAAESASMQDYQSVFLMRSEDGGLSWSEPELVSTTVGYRGFLLGSYGPALGVAFAHNVTNRVDDIQLRDLLTPDGDWSPARVLNGDAGVVDSDPYNLSLAPLAPGAWAIAWDRSVSGDGFYTDEIFVDAEPLVSDLVPPVLNSIEFKAFEAGLHRVRFLATFSEPLSNFSGADDVIITADGTLQHGDVWVEAAGTSYRIYVGEVSGQGTMHLSIAPGSDATDTGGNPIAANSLTADAAIDAAPPVVASFAPAADKAKVTITFNLQFNETVTGVNAEQIEVSAYGVRHSGVAVNGNGANYTVVVSNVEGEGWLKAGIKSGAAIADAAGNVIAGAFWSTQADIDTGDGPLDIPVDPEADERALAIQVLVAFHTLDNSDDHRLTLGEVQSGVPAFPSGLFSTIDISDDNVLRIPELLAYLGDGFIHGSDTNGDGIVGLTELLRVVQLYNAKGMTCAYTIDNAEDGFTPASGSPGPTDCQPHSADRNGDNVISLSEMLRVVQFFNSGVVRYCPNSNSEDNFCGA